MSLLDERCDRNELDVWRAELDAPDWPGPEELPAAERERAAAMQRPGAAAHWVAARWALRHVLAHYLDEEPAGIELALGPHGKPGLAQAPERLRFNLSHSGGIVLVAVSREHEVGVDVEQVKAMRSAVALAERALPAEDVAAVRGAPDEERAQVFHRHWARHEARLKCLGIGLGGAQPPVPAPVALSDLDLGPGYAAAVAVAAAELPPLQEWTLDLPRQKAG
jgi:4'-phosphopantetheinyl transferase